MLYQTTELELAAFLKARAHPLVEAVPQGRLVTFAFDDSAALDADAYFSGAQISARELFEAHRGLRALIQQVKEHQTTKDQIRQHDHPRLTIR
jgi:hypothetical protein